LNVLGIDPSQRHIGLCFTAESILSPRFRELKPEGDLLTCYQTLKNSLIYELSFLDPYDDLVCVEKQLSVGGQSSGTMLVMQNAVHEAIQDWLSRRVSKYRDLNFQLVSPLPIQLQKYIRDMIGFKGKTNGELVSFFKQQTSVAGRVSIHCVDAYYLTRLARDVRRGLWRYNLPSKEHPLHPWKILNGDVDVRRDKENPQGPREELC
jgi:hypothetical protein